MAQPYSTTAQVLNRVLTTLISSARWNVTDPGSLAVQDITYVALDVGTGPLTVSYTGGATAGSEVVSVSGRAITIQIQTGVSTATQVLAKFNASAAATALASASITGTPGTAQVLTGAPVIITGDVAQRIGEADRVIDAKLAGFEVALPFTTNPPLLQDLSVAYARYACFRDLYTAGDPKGKNTAADYYLAEFDGKWKAIEDGLIKLVDSTGAQVAMTKFATLTTPYPTVPGVSDDVNPNFPSGPYPDPPGIGYPIS
jgi:hypothetical protein